MSTSMSPTIPIVRIGVVILDPSSHGALSPRGAYGNGPRPAGVIATLMLRWSQHKTRRRYEVSWRARTKFPTGSGVQVKQMWVLSIMTDNVDGRRTRQL